VAAGTRERSAGLDRILAGKWQKHDVVQRDDRHGSVLPQEHVDPARPENHAEDWRRYCRATRRIPTSGTTQSAEWKPSLTDDDYFTQK
jgi:hypothetical protein